MEPLAKYSKNGYDFEIIERQGNWAIALGKSRLHGRENFEVIEVQSHNGLMMGNNWVPAKQYPPSDSQWGVKGFTAVNLDHAKQILKRETNS